MNSLFIWRNYVSISEEDLSEKIFDLLCEDCKDIGVVEAEVESEWTCNVEEFNCSCKGIFDMMEQGHIFIQYARELG